MQKQNSAHLNCGEGWNCCRVHSAERESREESTLIAIPLARHKGCLSASVNAKKLWQRTRTRCSNLLFEYAAQWQRRRTIIQSAQERDATSAPHMGKAHRQITSAFDLDIQFREAQMHSPPTNIMHSQWIATAYTCARCAISSGEQTRGEHRTLLSKQFHSSDAACAVAPIPEHKARHSSLAFEIC